MIDRLGNSPGAALIAQPAAGSARKVLRMTTNERMAGSIPVWEKPEAATQKIEENLSFAAAPDSFSATLAYQQEQAERAQSEAPGEFGFGDLVDMVNPLQHIPVVAYIYRNVTGDEIRPISQVVGGAVFGGALGAASGLVNVIVREETGKDIAENAVSFAFNDEEPLQHNHIADTPQERLNDAARLAETGNAQADLPGTLLAFADLGHSNGIVIKKADEEQKNPVNSGLERLYPKIEKLPPRETITWMTPRITTPYDIY